MPVEKDSEIVPIFSIKDLNKLHPRYQLLDGKKHSKKTLVAVDLDGTISSEYSNNCQLLEPSICKLITFFNKQPQTMTMGFTARSPYPEITFEHSDRLPPAYRDPFMSNQEFTERELESYGITFTCNLRARFSKKDCVVLTYKDCYPCNPLFENNIFYTDLADKGKVMYGFLPSIIHDIDAFHMIDNSLDYLEQVKIAIENINEIHGTNVKFLGYHYTMTDMLEKLKCCPKVKP